MFKRLHAALAALILLGAAAAPAWAQTKVTIGLIGTNESQIPILLAIDQGYFKAENLDVQPMQFRGGGVAVQALVGGSIDLAAFATDHVLRLANRGIDPRILIGIDRYLTHTLVVPVGKGYKGLADLKGKKLGVSAPGSYSDNTLRWALSSLGINPDRDVTIVGIGSGNTARAGLESGQVDAVMAATPDRIVRQQYPDRSDAFIQAMTAMVPKLISPDGRVSDQGYAKMTEILRSTEPDLKPVDKSRVDLTDRLLGNG